VYARFGGAEHEVESKTGVLRRAARESGDLKRRFVWAGAITFIATALRLAGPLVVRHGVDEGVTQGDRSVIVGSAIAFFVLLVLQYSAARASLLTVALVGERFLRNLRERVFRHLLSLDIGFFGRSKTGVLVSRMTSDVEALTTFVDEGAVQVLTSALMVVGVTAAMFLVDVPMALAILALLPFLLVASLVFRRFADRAYQRVREHIGRVLGTVQEGISGVRVVQAYTQQDTQSERFERVNERYYEANLSAARAISVYFPAVDFLRTVGVAVVLFFGGTRVIDGSMSIGSLFALLLYLTWFFEPILQLSNVYNLMQAAIAALDKLFGLLDTETDVPEPPAPAALPTTTGRIRLEGVRFGYDPHVPVIRRLDLDIAPGERVAVVGETGAGKSTVAKLAVRFHDPDEGTVLLDDVDLRALAGSDLRRHIVLVPQEGFLFSGTLGDNLRYARDDLDDEALMAAADRIGIVDWIASLPDGLDTEVRERGSRFSSGERQLVALARALVADPAVIVLDEATSNLDPETEHRVEAALGTLLEGRTAIVIAHRLATADRADRVVVMADGEVVEEGAPAGLIAAGGEYARLHAVWERGNR
jgi:ATP-binding cassette subfamily B protein